MTALALVLVLSGFVLGCVHEPAPVARPRTWRSSPWIPVAAALIVLAAVVLLGVAGRFS